MNFRGAHELLDFHVRLTPPCLLNDPFEGLFSHDLKQHLKTIIKPEEIIFVPKFSQEVREGLDYAFQYMKDDEIDNFINKYGVVSLTTNPNNLLMWAHYANEHKGICLLLKDTLFKPDAQKIPTKYGIENYIPKEVKYSDQRRDDKINGNNTIELIRNHSTKYLFTKSIAWEYEFEYRCIIPIEQADKLICDSELKNIAVRNALQRECDSGSLFKKEHPTIKGKCIYEGPALQNIAKMSSHFDDFIFLKQIDPSDIDSIIFGSRLLGDDLASICNVVFAPESKLSHVNLYRYKLNPSLFTLDLVKVEDI